jgi:hypothetical protein
LNFALRFFNLPNYFFFLGFRFYGIILLTGIFLYFYSGKDIWKQSLFSFSFKKFYRYLFFVTLPPAIVAGGLFLLNKIELGDPDYFYELGLSSIVDFPIYFIWNLPQFLILYTLLQSVDSSFRLKVIPNFILLFFFFSPELLSFPKISFNVFSIISVALVLLTLTLLIYKKKNPLTFSFYIFTSVWIALLLFGSSSETLLQTFLAKTYTSWDGFFEINKKFAPYILPSYFFLSLFSVLFLKKES